MSLVLILLGAVLVTVAMFNKVPSYVPGRIPAPRPSGSVATAQSPEMVRPRVRLVSARLTEPGKALLTTLGGSALIVAFFLTLSGL